MERTLIQQATDIINAPWHTKEDIKILSQIRFNLAVEFKNTNTRWSAREWSYNSLRSNKQVVLQETMAVGKAEWIAKADAEEEYGDYRELNAEAQGIGKILSAIEWFIISLQVEFKAINEVKF